MSTPSDPRTLVMHGLRLKGFGEAAAIGEAVGVAEADAKPVLDELVVEGLATYRDGRLSGFSLTKAGREHHAELLAAELDGAGGRPAVEDGYRRFLELNSDLLSICTAWQLREVDGESRGQRPHRRGLRRGVIERARPPSTPGSSRSAPTWPPRSIASAATALGSPTRSSRCGRRRRLVHQADDRQLPHRVVRDARGPAQHARHRARLGRRGLMASPRFGRVLTAMVTPFHDDGVARPRRCRGPGPLARRPRQRRARPRRHHRRGSHPHRRREGRALDRRARAPSTCRSSPAPAATTPATPAS